jgi:subtilisin-like proprotein convertase family protein
MRDGLVSRRLRARASALVMFMFIAALGGLAATVAPAGAATFSNSTAITMPDPDCTDPDVASPYPSNISVSGLTGTITDVNVTLTGVTHPFQGDIELLLVGPTGANLVVLSDAGTGSLSNATVTFDDAAASAPPQNSAWGPGTYKPVNYLELSGPDAFPAPAPAASANTTLAGAFNGTAPNGSWSLYVIDDACPDGGSIAGGWSLDITTASAAATTTSVTSSLNPSRTGQSVTFTATVQSGGSPVTAGTVTFSEGATVLAANVAVNAAGQATFSTSALAEGNHVVTATYNGTGEFATSAGTVNQRVDNNTTVTGTTYCNTGPITINDNGPATPYPSNVFVTGFAGTVGSVTVALKNVTHAFAGDVEALLVGPGGQNLVLVSDAGTAGVSNVTVNFDDAAAGPLPQAGSWAPANATVSADPTNYAELTGDVFPAPAPTVSAATTLATFNGSDPNGTWSLFVIDDAAPDGGSVAGGWCLTFTAAKATPTIATQASAGGPVGTSVTDTATVSGGAAPTGTVTFNLYGPNDATCAGALVFTSTVALAGSTATSGSFAPTVPGTYRWTAVYNGDANNDPATSPCNAPNESATIGLASPTISTQASPGGPIGTAVTDTATVSGGFSPTGTVTFRLFADSGCSSQVFTSTNALSGSTATSGSFTPTAPGTYYWTAVYNGDASNNQATSPCQAPNESVTITKASPTISTQASPGGLLGAPVRDVATLAGGQNPAGTVTFRLFSDGACTSEVFTSTNALAGTTATSDWFTPTAPGTYFWTAVYGGDANNNPATSPCQAPNESVTITPFAPPAPTRTLTGDVLGPVTVNAGESVLVTDARVVGPVVVNPGGALTIVDSRITQGVTVDAPSFLSICGSQIAGPPGGQALGVSNAAVPIRIGDPASGCAGNRLAGDVNLTGNLAVTFGANIVSRHVSVNSNGPGATVIKANNIFGMLSCAANNPAPTNAGQVNTAGSKSGQCAAL